MEMTVSVLALLLAAAAAVMAGLALRRTSRPTGDAELAGVPEDVVGLRREVAALRADTAGALRHLCVVRYDAYDEMGGQLSWSLALLDDGGDGVVVTSIHGRSEARTYARSVSGWTSEHPLSEEETVALTRARELAGR